MPAADPSFRPGARLSARPLHVVFLLDVSGSMAADGKLAALQRALDDTLPALRELAEQNPFARLLVRAVAFSDGAHWLVSEPTPVERLAWPALVAGGFTDLGAAIRAVAGVLRVPPMEPQAFPPVLVLVSDGRPTDDADAALAELAALPWGRRAVRAAVAIGSDVDTDVLQRFIGDPSVVPLTAHDPEQLAYLVRFVSVAASRLASQPAAAPEPSSEPSSQLAASSYRPDGDGAAGADLFAW